MSLETDLNLISICRQIQPDVLSYTECCLFLLLFITEYVINKIKIEH